MSDLEFIGRINPKPLISLRKEDEMRMEGVKKRILKEKSKDMPTKKSEAEPELTYVRDAQEDS